MAGSRHCVFCTEPRQLTRGHIFGDQLVKALPPGKGDIPFQGQLYQMDDTGKQWVQLEHREMPSSHEMPVRVICDPCNRVWMGGHETAVKAVLLNAQRRTTYRISRLQQETIASWICIISILSQYTSRAILPVTPAEVRRSFRLTDRIPAGTHIWLGRSAEVPWMQFGICHRLDPGLADEHHQGLRRYIYAVIFGPFAAILLGGMPFRFDHYLNIKPAAALQRIWPPPRARPIVWTPATPRAVAIDLDRVRWMVAERLTGQRVFGPVLPTTRDQRDDP